MGNINSKNLNDATQWLEDDDIITIPKELDSVVCQCCDCGLTHVMYFKLLRNGDLKMQFKRVDRESIVIEDHTVLKIEKKTL